MMMLDNQTWKRFGLWMAVGKLVTITFIVFICKMYVISSQNLTLKMLFSLQGDVRNLYKYTYT